MPSPSEKTAGSSAMQGAGGTEKVPRLDPAREGEEALRPTEKTAAEGRRVYIRMELSFTDGKIPGLSFHG